MAIPVRPDPAKYRGGATSNQYKSDLAAYNKAITVNNTGRRTTVEEDEEVVSLESSFDAEEDPFVPLVDYNAVASDDFEVDYNNIDLSSAVDADFKLGEEEASDEFKAAERIRNQDEKLANIGLTREDVDPSVLEDNTDFTKFYQGGLTDQNQQSRKDLVGLYKTDQAAFNTAFSGAASADKINFLYDQYTEGALDKDTYISLAGQALQSNTGEGTLNPNDVYFKNEGILYKVDRQWIDSNNILSFANEVVLFDDQSTETNATNPYVDDSENFRRSLGSTNLESADKRSSWVKARDGVIKPMAQIALGIATGGWSEIINTAIKGVSGETLHGADWANLVIGGLQLSGVIVPPVKATTDAATGVTTAATAGQGLKIGALSLSFDQSVALINAVGDTNVANALGATGIGGDIVATTLGKIGVPAGLIEDPDFMQAVFDGITVASEGGSFEDTLKASVTTYIDEGGSFGDLELTDGGLLDKITETLDPLIGAVDEFGNLLNDAVIQPAGDIIEQVTKPIIEVVNEAGSALDDAVIDPLGEAIETVTDPVIEVVKDAGSATEDVARDLGSAVDDALIEPVKEVIESIEVPDKPEFDLPEFEKPDLSGFGDIKLGGLGLGFGAGGRPSSSRTTDGLFGKELFKFKTKIGVSPEQPLIQAIERKQGKKQNEMPEEYADLFEDPFENPFNL